MYAFAVVPDEEPAVGDTWVRYWGPPPPGKEPGGGEDSRLRFVFRLADATESELEIEFEAFRKVEKRTFRGVKVGQGMPDRAESEWVLFRRGQAEFDLDEGCTRRAEYSNVGRPGIDDEITFTLKLVR
jgi:hypothetical protein